MPFAASNAINFLTLAPQIAGLDFTFLNFKIGPDDYRKDVADAFRGKVVTINVDDHLPQSSKAQYDSDTNIFTVRSTFDINGINAALDRATLVHESTHIILDLRKLGSTDAHTNEAVAYIAEAVYIKKLGPYTYKGSPLDDGGVIRTLADDIAQRIVDGNPTVPAGAAKDLVRAVSIGSLHYMARWTYTSNG